ncbi:Putative WD repeat domain-containing protein mip1 (Fragment) [Rhizopus microsporus]
MNPDLPADVFTACLTTPIEMSLRWVVMRNPLLTSNITMDMVLQLPGRATERRTPLGELNWIFTAVTDTIAWCVLQDQPELFKRLFRQDLMVASMFRNFLLADRIMRSYQCTPMSTPKLPETHDHPMWQAWDLAVDMCLFQLPALKAAEAGGPPYDYQPSTFFSEQLTAFEVWLSEGAVNPKIPEQLPIVLQVLLSQVHRLRALILLSRFLDLGPWAVNAALSVGIFPYVLKLLQSPAAELKPVLVFIWARILAVDRSCQNDLLKDHGYAYFINILTPNNAMLSIPHVSEHRAMSAFILSVFCTDFRTGQQACLRGNVISACLAHVNDPDPLLRQWVCLCLAQVWLNNSEAKSIAINENGHEKLTALLNDSVPEVRASAMYALGTFLSDPNKTEQIVNIEHNIAISALCVMSDGSSMVRREFVIALSHIVHQAGPAKFLAAATQTIEEDQRINDKLRGSGARQSDWRAALDGHFGSSSYDSVYAVLWKALLNLSVDPHPDVSKAASIVVDHITTMLLNTPLVGEYASNLAREQQSASGAVATASTSSASPTTTVDDQELLRVATNPHARRPTKLTRSVSFASTLRTIYNFGNYSYQESPNGNNADQPQSQRQQKSIHSSHEEKTLPLSSGFYDWSCEYFTEPQMRAAEADEPGSVIYTQRKWRRSRNEKILQESNMTKGMADDGVVRLYKNYDQEQAILVSSWRALKDMEKSNSRQSGLVTDWHQARGYLFTGGDSKVIKIWDAHQELPVMDIPTQSLACVTSITSDQVSGNVIVAGFGDGSIGVYDRRLSPQERYNKKLKELGIYFYYSLVKKWDEHKAWITNIHLQREGTRELVSGGFEGDIKIWDIRESQSIKTIEAHTHSEMTSLAVHDHSYVMASAGADQVIKVWNMDGYRLSTIRPSSGFLSQKATSTRALSFHPNLMVMAASGTDGYITLYGAHIANGNM